MNEALLISEDTVKRVTSISDNLAGKYILPSIHEAQEDGLRSILGDTLTDKVKDLVSTRTIDDPGYLVYKTLLEKAKYYLAYSTVVEVTNKVTYKVANFGVTKSQDENLQVADYDEVAKMQFYYQSKADSHCLKLQNWLLDNRNLYPELSECQCNKIRSNLYSAASCGIFLGGARGKGNWAGKDRRRR